MRGRLVHLFVLGSLASVFPPGPASAAEIAPTVTSDDFMVNGNCTLREAVQATNNNATVDGCMHDGGSGADTIKLAGQAYVLSIPPNATPEDNLDGDLDIVAGTGGLTIDGVGAASIIDPNGTDRAVHVFVGPGQVTISNLTVQDGNSLDPIFGGGGILNSNTNTSLFLNGVTVKESQTTQYGGGVGSLGPLGVSNSTIGPFNQVLGGTNDGGGGIYAQDTLTLTSSSITSNQAAGGSITGGGVRIGQQAATISDSQVIGNGSSGAGAGVFAQGPLTITGSKVEGNQNNLSGGGIAYAPTSAATLTIADSSIADNHARTSAGGISLANAASLNMTGSTISGNGLESSQMELVTGAGIDVGSTGTTQIIDSTISGNTLDAMSSGSGGGIYNRTGADTTVERSTISGNTVFLTETAGGGGITNHGSLSILNSTFSGNIASGSSLGLGGAIRGEPGGSATLAHVTTANNIASTPTQGKGISVNSASSITMRDSVVSEGTTNACGGTGAVASGGYNVERTPSGPGDCFKAATDLQGTDPLLGTLGGNGGPTKTFALGTGSPAIDLVPNAAPDCTSDGVAPLSVDQRGMPRPALSACDAGAFEVQPPPEVGGESRIGMRAPAGASATCQGKPATIVGTAATERLVGTAKPDVIAALAGNDKVRGLGGGDLICGGPGNDLLKGGGGRDTLLGQAGRDRLYGGGARDRLNAGAGRREPCDGGGGKDVAKACESKSKIP